MPKAVKHKQRLQPDHYSGTVNREVLALLLNNFSIHNICQLNSHYKTLLITIYTLIMKFHCNKTYILLLFIAIMW